MPHINVDENLPGIRALLAFSPETAAPISVLTNLLLRSNDGLSMAERELIAAHVSYLNDCFYCHQSHGEIAVCYLDGNNKLVEQVKKDYTKADIPDKLKLPKVLMLPIETYMTRCLLPLRSACSTDM